MITRKLYSTIYNLIKPYQSWEDINTRFIVSSGRTGTKFFENFFTYNFSRAYCLHEPYPSLRQLSINQYRKSLSSKKIKKEILLNRRLILNELYRKNISYYIESNPNLSLLIPYIKQIFPNYKFLVIIRNLKSYVVSAYNKSPDDSQKKFLYDLDDEQYRLQAKDISENYINEWHSFNRVEKIAWWWKTINNYLIEHTAHDKNCLTIRFEDLFDKENSLNEIKKIIAFFELSPLNHLDDKLISKFINNKSNVTQKKYLKDFDDLPIKQQEKILSIGKKCKQTFYKL